MQVFNHIAYYSFLKSSQIVIENLICVAVAVIVQPFWFEKCKKNCVFFTLDSITYENFIQIFPLIWLNSWFNSKSLPICSESRKNEIINKNCFCYKETFFYLKFRQNQWPLKASWRIISFMFLWKILIAKDWLIKLLLKMSNHLI